MVDSTRWCRRWFLLLLGLVDELEAARLQLALERLDLERRELVRFEQLRELQSPDRAGGFRRFEERTELLVPERYFDHVDSHDRKACSA